MEKKIYCLIHPRRKCIKYLFKKTDESEVNIIRQSLISASKTDYILQMMIKDKMIVLQKVDPDQKGEWCDIEETDVIENLSEIKVLLIPMPINITPDISSTESFDHNNLKTGESVEMDLNVIYTQSLSVEKKDDENKEILEESDIMYIPLSKDKEEQNINMEIDIECTEMISTKTTKKNLILNKNCIPYPCILPPLSFDLRKLLEEVGIQKSQRDFIRFWGKYLWQETNGQPSRQDYSNLALGIVHEYPSLAGGSNGNGIVRSQLSTWIRNHRASETLKVKRHLNKREILNPLSVQKASLVPEDMHMVETDIKSALTELGKKFIPGKNTSHIKRLLQLTKTNRRQWIENEAVRIVDIVIKYPPLKDYEMIVFEAIIVLRNIEENTVYDRIYKMIDNLKKYYLAQNDIKIIEISNISNNEKSQALIFMQLCNDLAIKRTKKKIAPLCTIKQLSISTDVLVTQEGDAPRLVLYTDDEQINRAFIVADKEIKVEISEPTTVKVIAGLLSSYYTWHRTYPSIYSGALEFMANAFFEAPLKSNSTVAKFKRNLDNFLKEHNT